jgi:uncharacterized protein YbjT (DUF2867 family)
MSAAGETALVVGATGALGTATCRELVADGWSVRGLVRGESLPDATRRLTDLGIELVIGDLKQPSSLAPAAAGASLVVCTASATMPEHVRAGDSLESVDHRGVLSLVSACEAAGCERFLYVSSNSRDDGPATLAKRSVEARLSSGRMPFTVLRPCRFMEVWLSPLLGFDPTAGRVRVFGSGHAPVSWICRDDVASFVRLCAADPGAAGETIELGGSDTLSQREVTAIFERIGGRSLEIETVPVEQIEADRAAASNPLLESFAAFTLDTAGGSIVEMAETLRRYPVRMRSVAEYAERVLATRAT